MHEIAVNTIFAPMIFVNLMFFFYFPFSIFRSSHMTPFSVRGPGQRLPADHCIRPLRPAYKVLVKNSMETNLYLISTAQLQIIGSRSRSILQQQKKRPVYILVRCLEIRTCVNNSICT
jgi:hypothetical protein